ncbi:MAG: hypothetical protein Q9170_002735 [Blastenia crenularia]
MSLYYDAASFLVLAQDRSGSLKSRVFGSQSLRASPKQVYALVIETSRWSPVLSEVIDRSQLLQLERKLSPSLALLLVHDLLLSKSRIAAPASHPLRVAVAKHKARLSAELTKIRIKKGFSSIEELRAHLAHVERSQGADNLSGGTEPARTNTEWPHPRWARINTLKTSLRDQLETTFAGYQKLDSLKEILLAGSDAKLLSVDEHIPNLIALAPGTDLTTTVAYRDGSLILQDKASCFPAYLLDPQPEHGDCLDACAAPGNKTTHLACIMHNRRQHHVKSKIWACERDRSRAETLTRLVKLAGCEDSVTVKAGQDFLLLDPEKAPWKDVGSLLLDPSCSGSGILGRNDTLTVTLPCQGSQLNTNINTTTKSRKRKRGKKENVNPKSSESHKQQEEHDSLPPITDTSALTYLHSRLAALSTFQLRLLLHAFRFPSAQRISYSTCSIHPEENEHVIIATLQSPIAKLHNWRLLTRREQVPGMRAWPVRGDVAACRTANGVDQSLIAEDEIAEACIRCNAGTEEGTQGFFIAAFTRGHDIHIEESLEDTLSMQDTGDVEADEEWEGFSECC